MNVSSILHLEGEGFLCALLGIVVYRLLTRRIALGGLLARKDGSAGVSAERVQLLVATLAVSVSYVNQVAHGTGGSMPDVSRQWLYLFAGSSGIYGSVKAVTTLRQR